MVKKRKRGRPKTATPKVRQFNFRMSEAEYELIQEAAGGYPPATWARVELLQLAERVVAERKKKGGGRR